MDHWRVNFLFYDDILGLKEGRRLKRDPVTNRFSDKDVAQILQSATDDLAQGFRARGIPEVFKVIEIMGIKQARAWNVCSLNEFRKFLGLKGMSPVNNNHFPYQCHILSLFELP